MLQSLLRAKRWAAKLTGRSASTPSFVWSHRRLLRCETSEDRRLLSVAVNRTGAENLPSLTQNASPAHGLSFVLAIPAQRQLGFPR
jgi:hypothetical protein